MKRRRIVQPGERLAIKPDVIQSGVVKGQKAMWWDMWTSIPRNERVGADGSVAVVHIRGALDHHKEYGADSYESIRARVTEALNGKDDYERRRQARQEYIWTHRYDDGFVAPEECADSAPPSAIILRIDSPGGVVSGLNETVRALRASFSEAGIPSVAFVDELGASAAYALACSCDEIVMTESAIAGSVGVIACMYDQVEADKKAGINVVTITSGARKSDGHPHVPVSDDAIAAERHRLDRSANAFFRLVARSRGLSPKIVKSYEAGIYQGPEAVERGLADTVTTWEALIASLSGIESGSVKQKRLANGGQPEPELSGTTSAKLSTRMTMTVTLKTRIRTTEAALAKETDPKRKKALAAALAKHKAALAALTASLEATKKTKIKYEESTEESEEEEEESEESAESEDDEEEASGNETDRKEDGDGDDGDEPADDDEEDEEEEESEEEESRMTKKAKAALAMLEQQTGKRGSAALGAAAAMFAVVKQSAADIATLKAAARTKEKADLVARAVRYVPRSQLAWLKKQPLAVVRGFVEQATKGAPIVHTDEGELLVPKASAPGTEESLSKDIIAQIDAAMSACPNGMKAEDFRKRLVDAHLADHKKRLASANGVGRV